MRIPLLGGEPARKDADLKPRTPTRRMGPGQDQGADPGDARPAQQEPGPVVRSRDAAVLRRALPRVEARRPPHRGEEWQARPAQDPLRDPRGRNGTWRILSLQPAERLHSLARDLAGASGSPSGGRRSLGPRGAIVK